MQYGLAQKLKRVGFPQWNFQKKGDRFCKGTTKECYIPTLEELIEACGEEFDFLANNRNGTWQASGSGVKDCVGDIPIEVVANLWLALKVKR